MKYTEFRIPEQNVVSMHTQFISVSDSEFEHNGQPSIVIGLAHPDGYMLYTEFDLPTAARFQAIIDQHVNTLRGRDAAV